MDDVLDITASSSDQLGKPANADLQLGLATAPVLFAAQSFPQINKYMDTKFTEAEAISETLKLVEQSKGVEKTKALAEFLIERAKESLSVLPDAQPKQALFSIAQSVLTRNK